GLRATIRLVVPDRGRWRGASRFLRGGGTASRECRAVSCATPPPTVRLDKRFQMALRFGQTGNARPGGNRRLEWLRQTPPRRLVAGREHDGGRRFVCARF